MKDYPTDWKRYCSLVRAGALPAEGSVNRFAARYRMASKLESVHFLDYSDVTSAGYTEGLRVALAYSALETLEAIAYKGKKVITVDSPSLSDTFRTARTAKMRGLLDALVTNRGVKDSLKQLVDDHKVVDLRPVAEGFRVLMFHGLFTPYGSGVAKSVTTLKFMTSLSREVINSTDQHFTRWLPPR